MRVTSFVAVIFVIAVGDAAAGSNQGAIALPARYSEDLNATSSQNADNVIWVGGMVRKQQAISPAEGLTVSKAIEIAGGFAELANRRKVHIRRPKENRSFIVDVKAVLEKKPGAEDLLLEAGDVVYVPTMLGE